MEQFANTAICKSESIDHLIHRLSEIPEVLAIFLGGSWSTGHGDKYGDIDIGILNDSGRLDESCICIIEDMAKHYNDSLKMNPCEAIFLDCDRHLLHVRCASRSDWQEALDLCEADPCTAEPWHLEILQTCHYLLPLFDPDGEAKKFKQQAQAKSDRFWHLYGSKQLQECHYAIARFQQSEKMPPLAWILSSPHPLSPIFRTLGAINRCFYFYGSRMEDYIECFSLKPEKVRERLAQIYRLTQDSDGYVESRTDEYESLVHDISRLFQDSFEPTSVTANPDREMQQCVSIDAVEEVFLVPAYIQTQEELLLHSDLVANMVYNWPGPLSKDVERGLFCYFQDFLRGDMISRLVSIILRLNNIDAISRHELDKTFSNLPVKPQNAYSRILEILFCVNPADTLAPLKALARETEALVRANEHVTQ